VGPDGWRSSRRVPHLRPPVTRRCSRSVISA
jgi:hypothetical protein